MNQQGLTKRDKLTVIAWLIDNFPGAFFKQPNQIKPLKIGIFEDIVDFYERLHTPMFSKRMLRDAINYYSSSPAYLNSQKPNAARVDLYGIEIDVVTEDQAKYAFRKYHQQYGDK